MVTATPRIRSKLSLPSGDLRDPLRAPQVRMPVEHPDLVYAVVRARPGCRRRQAAVGRTGSQRNGGPDPRGGGGEGRRPWPPRGPSAVRVITRHSKPNSPSMASSIVGPACRPLSRRAGKDGVAALEVGPHIGVAEAGHAGPASRAMSTNLLPPTLMPRSKATIRIATAPWCHPGRSAAWSLGPHGSALVRCRIGRRAPAGCDLDRIFRSGLAWSGLGRTM